MTTTEMKAAFEQAYGRKAEKIFFSPGRVRLSLSRTALGAIMH